MRLLTFAATLVAAALFSAPAGASTLYAPQYFSPTDNVSSYSVLPDGILSPSMGSPFTIGTGPARGLGSIALAPDGVRGAASFYFNGGIQGLTFGGGGSVSPAQSVVGSSRAVVVAVSPDGRFVYQAVGGAPKGVAGYAMDAAGVLTELPGSPYFTANDFFGLAVAPDGKHLYATESNAIRPFSIAADGTLTAMPAHAVAGVALIEFLPDGKHLIASTEGGASQLQSFAVAADGTLTPAGGPATVGSTSMGFFSVAPNGKHVYASDYNGATLGGSQYSINAYTVAADGSLSFLTAAPTGTFRPRTVSVSPDSRFLFAGDTSAGKLLSAPIAADGVPGAFTAHVDWSSGEDTPLVFSPEAAPTAAFTVRASSKPLTMVFNGADTKSPDGTVELYDWNFGDGGTLSSALSALTSRTFASAGKYAVTLTAVNNGCSTSLIYNGQTTLCNGSPQAAKTIEVDTPPWITSMKVSPSKVSRKTKIKFKLTEGATVTFKVQKPQSGRVVGGACKKLTKKNKSAKKCTRWSTASRNFTAKGRANKTTRVKFTGKVKKKKLKRGSYRLYATAKDSAGQVGPVATAKFKIRR